jgi:hypothetical protein
MRLCLFIFIIVSVFAQVAPAQTRLGSQALLPDSAYAGSKSDSVLAIHRLFQSRRTSGKTLTISALPIALGATALGSLIIVGNALRVKPKPFVEEIGSFVALAGLLPGIIGIPRLIRFRKTREKAIVSAYEQGNLLPVYVKRKLKPKYFH